MEVYDHIECLCPFCVSMRNYEELLTQAIGRRIDQETIERFKKHGLADRGQ